MVMFTMDWNRNCSDRSCSLQKIQRGKNVYGRQSYLKAFAG